MSGSPRPSTISPVSAIVSQVWDVLRGQLAGELATSETIRRLYATDASEYQELPAAVLFPKTAADVRAAICFARQHRLGIIPRTAGTSLAGQVVGAGLVIDTGRYLNKILAIDPAAARVRVEPGVIRNELNLALKPHGLYFGPETSTANRAMIGGMVGNNSCGSNSVIYGSVRDHLMRARGFLSDGSEVLFEPLSPAEFASKCTGPDTLETHLYRTLAAMLGDPVKRSLITGHFPKPSVKRRNTGYALDLLMDAAVFDPASDRPFNFCRLLAGSEGTLFFGTEFELNCVPLPLPQAALVCGHFGDVQESLRANLIALRHGPSACELIDRHVLECTRQNLEQRENREFVQGDPGAILVVEIRRATRPEVEREVAALQEEWTRAGLGYACPVLWNAEGDKVWDLRRAGQGLMSNVVGDAKPREVVEDTAVDVEDLPAYIAEFDGLMRRKYGISCVYYAHAGSGELHTRPLFNLKTAEGLRMFRSIGTDVAALVKRYRGSLSGEHGDGRLRGEFIRFMVGDECYELLAEVKRCFDPDGIFNPGKIIDTPPMDTCLRHGPEDPTPEYETIFDFSETQGMVRAAEKCNGSGDCRKTHLAGGTMCPSYMATREEKDSTRGRANLLRQLLSHPPDPERPWASPELREVLDLCLSCKGCRRECPSNVDMAKLKAEFLQHYYDEHRAPIRSRLVAAFPLTSSLAGRVPWLWNSAFGWSPLRRLLNRLNGFHPDRTIPRLPGGSLRRELVSRKPTVAGSQRRRVWLFVDEFTDWQDHAAGRAVYELLEALGYHVLLPGHTESGRASLSKGFLRRARTRARENVRRLAPLVSEETPLVGVEPSAILSFRDEYPNLLRGDEQKQALRLGPNCLLLEEFLAREMDAGRVTSDSFTDETKTVRVHGHCFQKALVSMAPTWRVLRLPRNYRVVAIPSGCCGMAGSFGYEREHYDLSMKIGELVLLPAVRSAAPEDLICASGTSCRHQIHDGTGRSALHPGQILRAALRSS